MSRSVGGQCEVFNLFARDIPQEGLSRIERGRKRKGLVPDFKFPGWRTGEKSFLAELKGLSSNETRYPRNPRPDTRAVDRRADGLTADYERKARKCDRDYSGTVEGQVGPVLARLQSYGDVAGFCFGKWGEVSKDAHELIDKLARARLSVPGPRPVGRNGKELEESGLLALYTGALRREFSFTGVRAQSRLLLDRLELLDGESASQTSRRCRAAQAEERRVANERMAQFTAAREC